MPANTLYYGDNLEILRGHVHDESVDLVYLDPPFNSNANYNVLFAEHSGEKAASQIRAFEDTWTWSLEAESALDEMIHAGGQVSLAMQAFRKLLGTSNMMAYLAMMTPRLVELRRVLKPTGSIYLHCDPTASHYLKILMDAVFGPENFRNEIVWLRTNAQNFKPRYFTRNQDVILFYSKSDDYLWLTQYQPYSDEQLSRFKPEPGTGRLYKAENLTITGGSQTRNFEWRGSRPPANRVWALSRERLEDLWQEGRILTKQDGSPRLDGMKVYLDELPGKALGSVWTDVPRVGNTSAERLGYPTQKPIALLERIIQASSNEGDVVLDPFCGCGTAIDAAQKLGRHWVGIDITYLAVALIRRRLRDAYGESIDATYKVIGEPTSVSDAKILAASDPYQFQWWVLDRVHARGVERKKGADKGIDGRIYFREGDSGETREIIISVKAGNVTVSHLRDLRGVIDREEAAIGVLVSMQEPTKPMRQEAASAGFYSSPWGKHPRLQLLTVEEILAGKGIDCPPLRHTSQTFKRAPKTTRVEQTAALFGDADE